MTEFLNMGGGTFPSTLPEAQLIKGSSRYFEVKSDLEDTLTITGCPKGAEIICRACVALGFESMPLCQQPLDGTISSDESRSEPQSCSAKDRTL